MKDASETAEETAQELATGLKRAIELASVLPYDPEADRIFEDLLNSKTRSWTKKPLLLLLRRAKTGEPEVLKTSTRAGVTSVRFGTSDVRDLSDGQLPVVVARVYVDEQSGLARDGESYNVRTQKQIPRRVRQCQQGWVFGQKSHVEIRNGGR